MLTKQEEQEFLVRPIPENILEAMRGRSYPADDTDCRISPDELAYLKVLHYGFDNQLHNGEIICNRLIAYDLLDIFKLLLDARYPIEKIRLIDDYDGDDLRSMEDNNSSAFNYRVIWGTDQLSNHALGCAMDINPRYNPYISYHDGIEILQPEGSDIYRDRTENFPHKIDHDDLCYQLFLDHGFIWGGDWEHAKDYHHFEKTTD